MKRFNTLNALRRCVPSFRALTLLGIASLLCTGCELYTSGGKLSMLKPPAPEPARPAIALDSPVLGPLHLAYTLQNSGCFSEVRVGNQFSGDLSLVASYSRSAENNMSLYDVLATCNLSLVLPIVERAEETAKFTVVDPRGVKHVYEYSDNCLTWRGLLIPATALTQSDEKEIERYNLRKMCSHLLNDMQKDGLLSAQR